MINPVIAEITFIRRMVYWMEKSHAIRAGHDTITAADAPCPVHQHYPVGILISRANGTHLDAGRLVALITELGNEKGFINLFLRNIFELTPSQIDPAVSKSVSRLFWGIGEYFSVFGHDVSFDPGSGHIALERYFVFELTGLYAETAADAFISID
jgi:hypothetical protein